MNTKFNSMYEWKDINWRTVERCVFKLQKRIFRASQQGNVKLVHRLQRLLINSWYGKLMAVRRVSQDNQGKKTAGVDGIKSLTPKQRLTLASNLKLSHKAKPTRRVLIPKPGTDEKRPLGIPTMNERARQALVKQAMEPEWEAKFEPNSYGFRPGRSAHDAIEAIFTSINKKPKWILDADIEKCFDRINHEKLLSKLNTYPTLRRQIKGWLKSGVIQGISWFPTPEGTPQGGVISPLLANIALHGMEELVKRYAETLPGIKRDNKNALSLIRYADDFVILHKDYQVIKECTQLIMDWLADIGLKLKPSKTKITHSLKWKKGLRFLGFDVRQYPVGYHQRNKLKLGFKTLIRPDKEKVKAHIKKLGDTIAKHKSSPQAALVKELNPIIRGWCNYNSTVVSKETFSYCDHILYQQLKRWAMRRHPNKNTKWTVNKYWHSQGNRNWIFGVKNEDSLYKLMTHSDVKIIRHTKVRSEKSPFDGDLIYWSSRMGKHPEMPKEKSQLLKKQMGKCSYCGQYFRDGDIIEIDHITPKALGGNNRKDNKQLLHRHCHDRKTATDLASIRDKNHTTEEPDEVKVSRPVLKKSRMGDPSA